MTRHLLLAALAATAVLVAGALAGRGGGTEARAGLVQLSASAGPAERALLARAGATEVAPELRLYRLPWARAQEAASELRQRGALRGLSQDGPASVTLQTRFSDPLVEDDWWRVAIGADGLEPPGPGRVVTIVDSGIEAGHPEFAGRPSTTLLNAQEPAPLGGVHGTAVASLVGAPENGVGIVGVYPQVALASWDAAIGEGVRLERSEIVSGILAAASGGAGVINLSLGSDGRDELIEQAVYTAVAKGSLVVAASGNDGDNGNRPGYPATLPHVLTVGSTDRANAVSAFSSTSRYVDVVAPGEDLTVASPGGFRTSSGTSFSAPIVSGAAAWIWTLRPDLTAGQVADLLRRSATDIGAPGRDDASGWGLINVRRALASPAPPPDPLEPNDDIDYVRPGGYYANGIPSLTTTAQPKSRVTASLDAAEDPRDVYRVVVPAKQRLVVSTGSSQDVDVAVWASAAISAAQADAGVRLGRGARPGTGNERVVVKATPRGRVAFVSVTPGAGVTSADYRLAVTALR